MVWTEPVTLKNRKLLIAYLFYNKLDSTVASIGSFVEEVMVLLKYIYYYSIMHVCYNISLFVCIPIFPTF